MKKLFAAFAAGVVALALCACSAVQQAKVATVATTINGQVAKACSVFKPLSTDVVALYALNPKVDAAIDGINALCVANAAIDPSTVQTLSETTLPAAIKALASIPSLTAAQIQQVGGALTLVNTTLAIGLQVYAVPTASAAAAASTPLAGAPLQ
ncbi:hypothetical protein [Paraburkholderia sp. BL17N1]|uniref:hypothetical protein n=1 Tax=Paraburkholderia sp. BL17N1 TaxID=1938798 RepID=UPI000EB288A7|nr:hypothetical protein [Paraburkholderia sp. BL17N1]RKR46339.1 hypothetical protein B0G82_4022 [Paraburkholderia sp. BL17N1]